MKTDVIRYSRIQLETTMDTGIELFDNFQVVRLEFLAAASLESVPLGGRLTRQPNEKCIREERQRRGTRAREVEWSRGKNGKGDIADRRESEKETKAENSVDGHGRV